MSEISNEKVLEGIDFPHNKWRKADEKGTLLCKNRTLVIIKRLRDAKMEIPAIQQLIADLYWDAFLEHELQVKESTGKTVKEFFEAKLKAELQKEVPCQGSS